MVCLRHDAIFVDSPLTVYKEDVTGQILDQIDRFEMANDYEFSRHLWTIQETLEDLDEGMKAKPNESSTPARKAANGRRRRLMSCLTGPAHHAAKAPPPRKGSFAVRRTIARVRDAASRWHKFS